MPLANTGEPIRSPTVSLKSERLSAIIDVMSHIAEKRRVNSSVLKALSILDAFRPECNQLSPSELGERTGLTRGSLYPIIYALEDRGYLRRLSRRKYAVGFRVVELANLVLRELDIEESVRPSLHRLASQLSVNAHLGILTGASALHLHREVGAEAVVVGEIVGWQAPAYCTALGKALLAQLPEDEQRRIMASVQFVRRTAHTVADTETLIRETREIAAHGYAVSLEEYHEGIVGIAAAVRDASDAACCAISISVTRPRYDREEKALVEAVRQAAETVSGQLRSRGMIATVMRSRAESPHKSKA
jgi:IclR family KDG regulon transcriptional repressor